MSIRRQIQMTQGNYEDYWLPGALCWFFCKKKGQILEVRPQNYENATIYVVQRIRNMGYTTTYTQHCGRVTRFKRNGPKRLLSFRFLNLMSPKRHINILLASL